MAVVVRTGLAAGNGSPSAQPIKASPPATISKVSAATVAMERQADWSFGGVAMVLPLIPPADSRLEPALSGRDDRLAGFQPGGGTR